MIFKHRTILGNSRGDTIIEVLIAIAVVSSVLGITYSIMNKNIQTTRDNQERSEASKIAQGQLELLRTAWFSVPVSKFTSQVAVGNFCMKEDMTSANVSNPNQLDDLGYDLSCIKDDLYYHFIAKNNADINNLSYTVTVRWNHLGGGRSEIVMAYKVQ